MKKTVMVFFATALVFVGCVSTKTHKMALDESESRLARLENTKKELEQTKEALGISKQAIDSSKKENEELKAQLEELSSKGIMTTKEIEALRQDKERLSASDKSKADEIAALMQEADKEAKERDYLKREVERLQAKTGELSAQKEKELADVKNTYENLVKEMKTEIEKGDIKITQAVDRLTVNLVEKILFDSGKAEVKPEGLKILKRVGDILKGVSDKQIRIAGHTDNVPIGAKIRHKYPTNWELSTTRATNVVRYLQDTVGVDPTMLFASGFSEYRPVATNKTEEGKAQNRRIEIVLFPKDIESVLEELKK